ncbi:hypothetical protein CORC01_10481 [Colletotrichum orchidophilum]|uniref:Uncharacterized protein n=1 Tax=Colletotrichum orchidophilum TaxID=1209926 RepID=A0A1G4AYP3_9PEZI|nr:uncharacterized protein CORC01_10481 [Colletotrichum orchidophilum]OHE94236.1 hypothetical protein CORC01_10481 [Colletotrichum orchidophilum]
MESPPASLIQARYSPQRDFAREDMKPAPLRFSPKSKELSEKPGIAQQELGASTVENATLVDGSSTIERATSQPPTHSIQLKDPHLAAIVSKFEILDIMTDLERQATGSHGRPAIEATCSPARNSIIRNELGVCVHIDHAKECTFGLVHDEGDGVGILPGKSVLPLPTCGNNGIRPQTPSPYYTLPRVKTWKTRPNESEALGDSFQAQAEPSLSPRPVNDRNETKALVEGTWTRSISKSLGYNLGRRTRPTREETQREYAAVSRGQRGREKLFGLWARAMDVLHSRDSLNSAPEGVMPESQGRPMMHVAPEIVIPVSRKRINLLDPETESSISPDKPHLRHTASITVLPESSSNIAGMTGQSKVASLRRLFDKGANDAGLKSGSRLRRSHTGPPKKLSASDRRIQTSPSKKPETDCEANGSKGHAENRFESLGFKRGREVWRKISASWDKDRSEEGNRNERDHSKETLDKSREQPTWQGSCPSTARTDDIRLANSSPDKGDP